MSDSLEVVVHSLRLRGTRLLQVLVVLVFTQPELEASPLHGDPRLDKFWRQLTDLSHLLFHLGLRESARDDQVAPNLVFDGTMSVYLRQELVPILDEVSLFALRDRCFSIRSKAASAGISPRRDSLVSIVHPLLVVLKDILELLKHISLLSGNCSRIDSWNRLSRFWSDLDRILHVLCLNLGRNVRGNRLLLL